MCLTHFHALRTYSPTPHSHSYLNSHQWHMHFKFCMFSRCFCHSASLFGRICLFPFISFSPSKCVFCQGLSENWIGFSDPHGNERVWEVVDRKTRTSVGFDAGITRTPSATTAGEFTFRIHYQFARECRCSFFLCATSFCTLCWFHLSFSLFLLWAPFILDTNAFCVAVLTAGSVALFYRAELNTFLSDMKIQEKNLKRF